MLGKKDDVWKVAERLSSFTIDEEKTPKSCDASFWEAFMERCLLSTVINRDSGKALERAWYVWCMPQSVAESLLMRPRSITTILYFLLRGFSNKHSMEKCIGEPKTYEIAVRMGRRETSKGRSETVVAGMVCWLVEMILAHRQKLELMERLLKQVEDV